MTLTADATDAVDRTFATAMVGANMAIEATKLAASTPANWNNRAAFGMTSSFLRTALTAPEYAHPTAVSHAAVGARLLATALVARCWFST
jgi:hypothetical protein